MNINFSIIHPIYPLIQLIDHFLTYFIIGLSIENSGVATIFIGLIKVIFTFISLMSVDRIGRRSLLLIGSIGLTISLMALSILFNNTQSVRNHELSRNQVIMALISLGGAVASYSLGFGPVTWLVVSELFPDEIRGRTLGKIHYRLYY